MTDDRLRAGLIGCGNVAVTRHIPALLTLDGVRVSGISDPVAANREQARVALQLSDRDTHADHQILLKAGIDYAVVAAPPKFRRTIVEDCAKAGVHVLTEKPLAIVPAEGQAMIDLMEAADYRAFAQEATQVGQRLAEADVTFSYHNHSSELMRLGSRTGLDIIFAESDPRYVLAEIDTYWIQHGGGDPADWIRRMKNRMPVVHFKDMVILEDGSQTFAEVGEGNLNWPAILAASQDAGVSWYVVEQDTCRGDPFESLRISYQNLTKMGLT